MKRNYGFEKRQKELAKQKKKEEKKQKKMQKNEKPAGEQSGQTPKEEE